MLLYETGGKAFDPHLVKEICSLTERGCIHLTDNEVAAEMYMCQVTFITRADDVTKADKTCDDTERCLTILFDDDNQVSDLERGD